MRWGPNGPAAIQGALDPGTAATVTSAVQATSSGGKTPEIMNCQPSALDTVGSKRLIGEKESWKTVQVPEMFPEMPILTESGGTVKRTSNRPLLSVVTLPARTNWDQVCA